MQTYISFFEISAYKIPCSDSFNFDNAEYIENVNKNTIQNWEPLNRNEVILTATFSVGIKGKMKKGEDPYFYITIVTNKMVHLLKNKKRLFTIPYYESWNIIKMELDSILETNNYQTYDEFVRGISKYFKYEYEFSYNKLDQKYNINE